MSHAHLHTFAELAFVPRFPLVGGDLTRQHRNADAFL